MNYITWHIQKKQNIIVEQEFTRSKMDNWDDHDSFKKYLFAEAFDYM